MKNLHKKIIVLLVSACVTFLMIEAFVRYKDPIGIDYFFENLDTTDNRLVYREDMGYYHYTPNAFVQHRNYAVKSNSEGFRWDEFQIEKPEGTKRILIIGDSLVFGFGAPQATMFPHLIQNKIDEKDLNYEVIPVGAPSWSTGMEYSFLKNRGMDYSPDVLILMLVYDNDVFEDGVRWWVRKRNPEYDKFISIPRIKEKVISNSYFLASLRHIKYVNNLKKEISKKDWEPAVTEDMKGWQDTKKALNGIIDICDKNGIQMMTFMFSQDKVIYKNSRELFQQALSDRGIEYYKLPEDIYTIENRVSLADAHPNENGHRIIADMMYEKMGPMLESLEQTQPELTDIPE